MDERSARVAAWFEGPLIVAALLTVPALVISEAHVGPAWRTVGEVLDWAIWLLFLAEVVTMLAIVPARGRWLRHHFLDVLIVVLSPPFITGPGQSIRLLRLLRLLRLGPLVRYLFSEEGVRAVAALALLTVVAGGVAFASVERLPVGDGLYWAVETMTTVGYGDITPHTAAGKVIAVVVMFIGIGAATVVIGAVAQRFAADFVRRPGPTPEPAPGPSPASSDPASLLDQIHEVAAALDELQARLKRHEAGQGD